jgi:putative phage-type endonuclease
MAQKAGQMNVLGIYYPQPEWFQARLGLITSSKVHDAITLRQKGGTHDLADRRKLKMQIIAEMTTGKTPEHYVSAAMDWGIDNEPRARAEYEYRTGQNVEQLGLVMHPTNPRAAATADGWVAPNGILEIKCPETYTHYEYCAAGAIPQKYLDQINWQMACAGPEIEWCDFVSFDPRIEAEELQLLVIRHERDEKRIAEMETAVDDFLTETLALFEQIKRGAKYPTLEDKLRASIRQANGYPEDPLEITTVEAEQFIRGV